MKNLFKVFGILILAIIFAVSTTAQDSGNTQPSMTRITPYKMEVTYDKTSHLIFPSAIRYVDLGSEYLIAGKAEGAENVLRVKASVRNFEPETNFTVITDDGRFYSFDVFYSVYPDALSYDLLTMRKETDKDSGSDVYFEELGKTPPSLAGLIMENIYRENKRTKKHVRAKNLGIVFTLKGIYIHNGKYYFHTEIKNRSNVPFEAEYINFKIADKKRAKRTVVQERTVNPVKTYKPLSAITENTAGQNVFMLDQFTMTNDKRLLIEVFEKNGGRHQRLRVGNADLINARLIIDDYLKF